ncbi:MAG: T9SS type B sorting domain-containing protein [Weeksellaceae bacterium]
MIRNLILFISVIFAVSLKGQEMSIYEQFLGKYDFTMIGNTMNTTFNGTSGPCVINTSSSANLNLLPDQTVVAAYLYWGGSGNNWSFDFDIKLNGTQIPSTRNFASNIAGRAVSGGFADVTDLVMATGNGTYTVTDFDLTSVIWEYCANGTNFGGWSILVVYSSEELTNNLVNIYDGFARVDSSNTTVQFELENLNILHLVGNKIAFLAYEGDANIQVQESLRVNGNIIGNPPLNPLNNVFNGTNSYTNSNTLYNMDIDFFDIGDGYTNIGDDSMIITLESHQDAVIIHNVVVVLNSEVPDATINIQTQTGICDERDVDVDYTVYNEIATDILPAGTEIAFYADDVLVGQSTTQNEIPIGGFETGNIVLTIPDSVPNNFILTASVDDDGTGNGAVIEFDEDNNTAEINILLGTTPTANAYPTVTQLCDSDFNGTEIFDLTTIGEQILGIQPDVSIAYYENQDDANAGNANTITNPENYSCQTGINTIWVRLADPADCNAVVSFDVIVNVGGEIEHNIPNIEACSLDEIIIGITTDLTVNDNAILGGNDPTLYTITYHHSQQDAETGSNPIPDPENYQNVSSPETIWVRLEGADDCAQYGSFELIYNPTPQAHTTIVEKCTSTQTVVFILQEINQSLVNNTAGLTFTYYATEDNAQNQINPLPNNYTPTETQVVIYARIENGEGCFSIVPVTLKIVLNYAEMDDIFPQCDSPYETSDGFAQFDLTSLNTQINNLLSYSNAEIKFYTTLANAESETNPIPNPEAYTNMTNPQTIFARAYEDGNQCAGTVRFQIQVLPVPSFEMETSLNFCSEEADKSFVFEGFFETYTWYNPSGQIISQQQEVNFDSAGIYTLEVTGSGMDCPAKREIEVVFYPTPEITNVLLSDNTASAQVAGGIPPLEYSINNGLSWNNTGIFPNLQPGDYEMIVRGANGCYSEVKKFSVLGITNFLSPNGDGINDYWEIRGMDAYPNATIKIFDRYGKIFVDKPLYSEFIWDGKYMGRNVPSGDYWFILTMDETYMITGHISVRNQ